VSCRCRGRRSAHELGIEFAIRVKRNPRAPAARAPAARAPAARAPAACGRTFIHLLQVLLALRDEPIWRSHLTHLAGGEYELLCPDCGRDLFAVIDADEAVPTEGPGPTGDTPWKSRTDRRPFHAHTANPATLLVNSGHAGLGAGCQGSRG
jgi:hypothetical protein